MMDGREMVEALRKCSVQTGSLMCLGCGHEHNCGIHGCAILRDAADLLEHYQQALAALAKANTFICRRNEALWTDYDAVCRERAQLLEDFEKSLLGDPCEYCGNFTEDDTRCVPADLDCEKCHDPDCPCKDCRDCDKWTWRGAEDSDHA